MNRLTDWLERACQELGLKIELGFMAKTPSNEIRTDARIENLGDANGMLVFSDFSRVREYHGDLQANGYAYSVLDDPLPHESFDLDSYIEMFRDWGWTGPDAERPHWMGHRDRHA